MLFHLVKKDFILAKKYLWFMLIFAVIGPIFIYSRTGFNNGSAISFFITVLFVEFILYNMTSMAEEKYKGAALLCTTPHTRNGVIKAKYLFVLVIFIGCFILYNLATVIGASVGIERLNTSSIGASLLIISIFYGILIPVQIKFGYEKTRFIFFIVIFLTPFVLPYIIQYYQSANLYVNFHVEATVPKILNDWFTFVLSLIIGLISMLISTHIFSKKNL